MFHKLLLATEHPCVHVIIPVLVHRALLLKFFLVVICGALHFTMWQAGCKKYSLKEHNSVIDTRAKKLKQ